MEGKPAGLVYTCIIIKDRVYEFCDQIDLPRNELRQQIVNTTIKRIKENL
jgi:nicotinamide mononucleotide (NMN) deamidase PncC